jgi:hypothetical protein
MLDIKYITWIYPGNFKYNSFVNFYDNQYICEIKFCKLTSGSNVNRGLLSVVVIFSKFNIKHKTYKYHEVY